MAFKLKVPSPVARMEWYWATTSTAFTQDSLLVADGSISVNGAVATTATSVNILGSLQQAIASTDTNYTTQTTKVPVLVDELGTWEADIYTTGSPSTTAVYEQSKCDLYNGIYINTSGSTTKQFAITNFVSSAKVQGKITTWFGTCVS